MSLKGTQVSSSPKQASALASSPAKPLLPGVPASSSRLMRNSSSLRGRGGDANFPGLVGLVGVGPDTLPGGSLGAKDGMAGYSDRGVVDLGVVGVGAPGMPPAAAREPTAVVLQRRTSNLRPAMAAAAVSLSQDSSCQSMAEVTTLYAAGSQHHDLPSKRRPRAGVAAAAAISPDSSDMALSQFSADMDTRLSTGDVSSPRAGPQAFQLKWPLQPQPVNTAQTHLSKAAAKIAAAADRYSSAVGATTNSVADMQPPAPAGVVTDGRRSSLSRRSGQSSAHSSTHSSELSGSAQTDPFASRPLIAHDMMLSPASTEASPSGRAQRGPAPTRRALFASHLQGPVDWPVTASRNLDAPEMGSPRSSDEGDTSSSGSSQSSSASGTPARVAPPSPFGAQRGLPRAHSAFVPSRSYAPSDSSLVSAESAPAMAHGVDLRGSSAPGDGDAQGTESPKKAGRLQHLKMRVAEARKTVTAGAVFRPFPGDDWQASERKAGVTTQPYGVGPLETCPPPGSPCSEPPSRRGFPSEEPMMAPKSPPKQIAPRRKIRVTPPAEVYKDGLAAFSPSPCSPPSAFASRTDIDSESSTPATPSASTPSRTRALSSALEDRANSLTSASSPDDIPSAQDLQPSANPAALLTSVLQQLHQANTAKRKELDWQTQNQALNGGRRLVAHHANVVGPQLHSFVLLALPSVEALRSTTSRTGMLMLQEMFLNLRRGMDNELDSIVTVLAKRSGEVSAAGRDNFLAAESDKTMALMIECCSEIKVATALLAQVQHKSPQVRAKVASHLDSLLQGERGVRLAGAGMQLDRVFKAAVGLLEEGSLDARTHGKRIIWQVKDMVRMEELKGMVGRIGGGEAKQRKVWEVLDSAAGPPPLPLKSAYSSRSPSSRQGVGSPWGSTGLDLPSTPNSPSNASRPPAMHTPPRSTRSPMAAKGVAVTLTDDSRSIPSTSGSCLLSEYNPFSASPGSPGNLGGYGLVVPPGLGLDFASAASGGSDRHGGKGLGRPGYAAKAGYGSGARDVSVAAARSRRRTSISSDHTDNGKL
ncbi:hypothetical protein ABBQ38_001638 [Trebouxia sp. C0009 RCD-2024]